MVPVLPRERITYVGDSLTAGYNGALPWPEGTGNFIEQLDAILGPGNESISVINGVPSIGIDYLISHIATMVFASDPTLLMLWIGTNDAVATDDFYNKYVSYLTQIKVWKPTIKIVCIGTGVLTTEYWTIDGGTGLPVFDPARFSLDTYNDYIAQGAAAMGCQFVNWRRWLLAWEAIHNPGKGVSGFATVDGTHYNDAGQKQIAAAVLAAMFKPAVVIHALPKIASTVRVF